MIRFLNLQKISESFQPQIGQAVDRVIQSGLYVRGDEVAQFEKQYAAFITTAYCVGVGNGFDALRLIFKAWILTGVMKAGDEVIVPANTYIASILAVTENRLVPVFVEPDINTFNIDPARIEEKLTRRTKAIMVVHLYGRNAMHPQIKQLADAYHLRLVEDNAQATGCVVQGKHTGSLGDAAAHSFFPTKNLGALGDGGAITTEDPVLADTVRTLGNYGAHKKGVNNLRGLNSRLDEMQAAILNVKLPRLDADNKARRNVAKYYLEHIKNALIILPQYPLAQDEHVWHLFVVRCHDRDALQKHLSNHEIETLVHYPIPPHKQKAYTEMNHLNFPVTEQIHSEVLSLPLSPVMEEQELERVVEVINGFEW